MSYIDIHLETNVDLKTGFLRIFLNIYRSQTNYILNFFFYRKLSRIEMGLQSNF